MCYCFFLQILGTRIDKCFILILFDIFSINQIGSQAFIQAVSLMLVFEQRLSFLLRLGSQSGVSSSTGSWRRPGGVQGWKTPEKVWSFYFWSTNK